MPPVFTFPKRKSLPTAPFFREHVSSRESNMFASEFSAMFPSFFVVCGLYMAWHRTCSPEQRVSGQGWSKSWWWMGGAGPGGSFLVIDSCKPFFGPLPCGTLALEGNGSAVARVRRCHDCGNVVNKNIELVVSTAEQINTCWEKKLGHLKFWKKQRDTNYICWCFIESPLVKLDHFQKVRGRLRTDLCFTTTKMASTAICQEILETPRKSWIFNFCSISLVTTEGFIPFQKKSLTTSKAWSQPPNELPM